MDEQGLGGAAEDAVDEILNHFANNLFLRAGGSVNVGTGAGFLLEMALAFEDAHHSEDGSVGDFAAAREIFENFADGGGAAAPDGVHELEFEIGKDGFGGLHVGIFRPVVLLPEAFAALEPEAQTAIASHELIHVCRRDWAVSLAEEAAAALFWFHPGVWWLLSKIRLVREQLVDSEVVRLTGAPEPYVRSLIAIAGLHAHLDLVPAPLFLRRRHLTLRMHSILKEVRMSRIRLSVSYVSITAILAGAAWTALVSFS